VDAKKKKGKTSKKKVNKTKDNHDSEKKFDEDIIKEKVDDEGESTIQELDNIAVLHSYIKQDQFVLLYVHHEDSDESEEVLEEFRKTEQKLRGYAHFLLINCAKEQFQNEVTPMCQNEADSGIFPLISGFVPPSTRFNPYTKEVQQNQETPFGERKKTEKGMSKFVTSNIPNFVSSITKSKEYDTKLRSKKAINKVVLFSEKNTPPVLFKALATKFKDKIDFFFADSTKLRKKTKELKITDFPTIMVYSDVSEDGEKLAESKVITYEGKNNIEELIKFLIPYALAEPFDPKSSEKPQYQRRGKYTFVNHKNYTRGFIEDYRAQVVFFEKDFKNIQQKFETIASVLHGPTNVVFFNCDTPQSQEIAKEKFGVTKFPKLLVFSTGAEKNKETALDISVNTEEDEIVNIIEGTEIKDNLREASESVLSSLIVNNALQLNKITLVYLYEGEEDEVPLSFRSISTNPIFAENFEFIAFKDPGAMTLQQFQVPRLPVIIGGLPPPEGQEGSDAEGQGSLRTMIYQGDINDYFELLEYNLGVLQTFFPDSKSQRKTTERTAEASTNFQEVTYDNFDDICESMKGL